jgi:hypothetical protein
MILFAQLFAAIISNAFFSSLSIHTLEANNKKELIDDFLSIVPTPNANVVEV